MPHPHVLRDIALFVEVAKCGSFSRAAVALDMPISSLSRRITLFEAEMGLRLIERTTRKVALTPHGETYLPRAARIVDEAQRSFDDMAAQAKGPSLTLRLAVPADAWVLNALADAIAKTPLPERIGLSLDSNPIARDGAGERYDLAIVAGREAGASFDIRKVAELERGLYASNRYLQAEGKPVTPQDLAAHRIILHGEAAAATWRLVRASGSTDVTVIGRVSSRSSGFALRLAASGLGIVAASAIETRSGSASGRLARVLPEWNLPAVTVSIATTSRSLPLEARDVIERLATDFAAAIEAAETDDD